MEKGEWLFIEKQRINKWIMMVLVILTITLPLYYILNADAQQSVMAWLTIGFILVVLGFLFLLELRTYISKDKIKIYFFPLFKKEWRWDNVKKVEVLDYGFVGGWGIRWRTPYGTVYNMKGNKGLHFYSSKKEYTIGTSKDKELTAALNKIINL